ncbi:Tat pathway signal protein [Streptomyces sp. NPDC050509]|uniref:Tat pathway signal protein n=1 Tax=Streptomyces sp. NPDC050509 TaxID=3365620 RepID=UPI0037B6173C
MTRNTLLAARMAAAGLTQQELADSLNLRIESFTGRTGTVTDRHVRNWIAGKTKAPRARQRRALEEEFGCLAEELGFAATACRSSSSTTSVHTEDPVRRRAFAGTAAAVAAATIFPSPSDAATRRVGMADANRLEAAFAELIAADNQHGGTADLETRALSFVQRALELQKAGHASQRVRSRLYYLAAAFTGTAVWAALDARRPDRAERHIDRAMTLAGLAGSSDIQLFLWGHTGILFNQQQRRKDALAAADAGRATQACRRDPLMRSLAASRLAVNQANSGDHLAALRSFDLAVDSFSRTDLTEPRPTWLGFYDQSELFGLGALAMAYLGRHDQSEAYLHRTLAVLRPECVRNRQYYTAHLALAQLRQHDFEQACVTAASVLAPAGKGAPTGRTGHLAAAFTRELSTAAPGARTTALWTERYATTQGGHA